jgi:polyisoprenoid-binding protein YceI
MSTAAVGFWLLVPLFALRAQGAELYRLDSANTRVSVDVRLFGLPWVSAHFEDLSGDFVPDGRTQPSRVDVTVRTASLECDNSWWNARLLSAEWFDAQRYPRIIYHSDRIEFDARGGAVVTGQLTLHGVTRKVELIVNRWTCSNGVGADDTCSFDAHTRIKRSEYGLPHGFWDGGDVVDIHIHGVGADAVLSPSDSKTAP